MRLTIVGSGDAFGSGGRLQTCFHVATGDTTFLIDCGATSLIGMTQLGLDAGDVDVVFVSHLHGDHYSGLVWFVLHAQHIKRRTRPLAVVGPRGIQRRYETLAEALFPGTSDKQLPFELQFYEHVESTPFDWGDVVCSVAEVVHPSGAPSYGLRVEIDDKVLSFSGDTEWVDALIGLSDSADLHINECFGYDKALRYHTNWMVLREKLPLMSARKIVLTHMNDEMLANVGAVDDPRVIISKDGLQLDI